MIPQQLLPQHLLPSRNQNEPPRTGNSSRSELYSNLMNLLNTKGSHNTTCTTNVSTSTLGNHGATTNSSGVSAGALVNSGSNENHFPNSNFYYAIVTVEGRQWTFFRFNVLNFKSLIETLRVKYLPTSSNISLYYKVSGEKVLIASDEDLQNMVSFHLVYKSPMFLEVAPSVDSHMNSRPTNNTKRQFEKRGHGMTKRPLLERRDNAMETSESSDSSTDADDAFEACR